MTPLEFLAAVWPDDGHYCIATPFPKGGYQHKVYPSIEEAAAYAISVKDERDVFFCVHTLKQQQVWNPEKLNKKTGEKGAYEVRTQANTQSAKAFFFDLDVGNETHKYGTQRAAIKGLKDFLVATGLPAPMLTSSGGGLHVYWLVADSIPSAEWRETAAKLKALAHAHNLKIDNSRTTDTSSVLRVAGTFNLKQGGKRPVSVLAPTRVHPNSEFISKVDAAVISSGAVVEQPRKPSAHSILGSQGAMEYEGPPVAPKALAAACVQMQYLIRSKGNVPEPLWYHGIIGIARFTTGGRSLVHKMSQGHPDYTFDGCEAKIESHEARRGSDGRPLGPTGCAKLRAELPPEQAKLCSGCPFEGKVHGPISAARYKDDAPAPVIEESIGEQVQTVEIPPPPKPYSRLKSGGITVMAKNKDGDEIHTVLLPYDLYPIRRIVNTQSQIEQQMWRVVLPREGAKDFVLDADALYDRRKFVTTMSNQGIYPTNGNVQHLQDYMVAYIAELQKLADAEAQCNHLGWAAEHTQFIMPDKIMLEDGSVRPATLSLGAQRASAQVTKKGTLRRQLELLRFHSHPAYVAHQVFILGSLAAPLFYMTGHHGMIVNASGDAGASKSTSLYTAASLWGDPSLYTINGTNDGATPKARNERVAVLANLPICVDEITHIPLKDAKDLAMSISQPGQRLRLASDGVERSASGSHKATIMLSTANSSLHNLLSIDNAAGTAGSMRVFEMYFRPAGVHKKHEADDFLFELRNNYGHVGEVFTAYVLKNRKKVHARVREVMREIDEECDIQGSERFWSAYMACVIVAGEIAVKLHLLDYDITHIRRWLIDVQIPFMRGVVVEEYSNPIAVLADYLETINGHIIVVDRTKVGNLVTAPRSPRDQMLAHWSKEERSMWVLKKAFKDHCAKIGANSTKILNELSELRLDRDGNMSRIVTHKNIKKVLGAGTEHAKAQTWCFVVNMSHPEVSGAPNLSIVKDETPSGISAADLKLVDGAA